MWKPNYASLVQMRDWLRLRNREDTDNDALLRLKLGASSRAVDRACHRQFGKVTELTTRSYDLRWSRTRLAFVADIDDIMDLTDFSVTVDGTEIDPADYALFPRNALADGKPYTELRVTATITGDGLADLGGWFGWNAPWPDVVTESTLLQTSRLNVRRDSPYGIAGGADSGAELRLLERLDPDIKPLLSDVMRPPWAAR